MSCFGVRLRFMVNAFRNGAREGYPLCCVVAFCLGRAKGVVVGRNLFDVHRACVFHRKKMISDYEHLVLLNGGVCPLPKSDFDWEGNFR